MSLPDLRATGSALCRLAACAVLAAASTAACAGSAPPAGSVASTADSAGADASLQDLTTAYLQYAACARSHGLPDLPDPVVDQQGNDDYPGLTGNPSFRWPPSVLTGCASVWDHVHAVRDRYDASHGLVARANGHLTPAQALALSRCIRQHGFPDYPDPGPNGIAANPPPGFAKPNLSDAAKAAIEACAQVNHG
jgi:hypothetical protein